MGGPTFTGGEHTHFYNPPSQLDLESKDTIITIRFTPSEAEQLKKLSKVRGKSTSNFLRLIILKYLKIEKKLTEASKLLDDILM